LCVFLLPVSLGAKLSWRGLSFGFKSVQDCLSLAIFLQQMICISLVHFLHAGLPAGLPATHKERAPVLGLTQLHTCFGARLPFKGMFAPAPFQNT
jgi:hypothetical protein